jgi:putative endonuclease
MTLAGRQRAERRGRQAEWLASMRLRLAGYRIIARNVRTPAGEIDLVARRGRHLAFVEVKARAAQGDAAAAIAPRQQARIRRAAEIFLARRPDLATLLCRFDAILVCGWRPPRHIVDAWRDMPARTK